VGCTMAQLAIAWTLHKGEHIIPIPGTRHLAYAQENFAAIDVALSSEQITRLDQLINRHTVHGARYNAQTQPEIDTEQFAD
jgi:aryl-alcohol dehydrogenase-like predicted oxidoreductase